MEQTRGECQSVLHVSISVHVVIALRFLSLSQVIDDRKEERFSKPSFTFLPTILLNECIHAYFFHVGVLRVLNAVFQLSRIGNCADVYHPVLLFTEFRGSFTVICFSFKSLFSATR